MTRLAASLLVLICCVSLVVSQEAAPTRVRIADDVARGLVVKKVTPAYPPLARQAHIQGTVVLKVLINKSGDIYDVTLVSGHPMLAPAAIEAVKQWKYQPYLLNGEPVEVDTTIQVNFKLAGEPPATGEAARSGVVGDVPGSTPPGTSNATRTDAPPNENGQASPWRIRVSSGVSAGLLKTRVNPTYPPDARKQHIQGVVVLKVNIDKEGNVYGLELISGHPSLAAAAMEAVRQWKYKPYLLNGTPIEVETEVQVNFTLSGG